LLSPFISKSWRLIRLGEKEICEEMYYGITAKASNKVTGLKMLRTTDIANYKVDWSTIPYCEVTEKRSDLSKYYLRQNDIIVARAGTVGVSVLIEKDMEDVIFGSYLIKIRVSSKVYPKFLHYFFQSKFYWQHLQKAQGSTLKNINLPLLKNLLIPLPPLPEQKKIAEILRTVDEAIDKVEEAIERTERLKKGLMQELLTKGIGHREFKDTEIGRIPKEWEVVRLREISRIIRGASPRPKGDPKYFSVNKTPFGWLKISDLSKYMHGMYLWGTDEYLTEEGVKKSVLIQSDNLLISNSGTVGKPVITKIPVCIHDGFLAVIDIQLSKTSKEFLYYLLDYKRKNLEKRAPKGTQANLNTTIVKNLKIPLPPLLEQRQIAEILMTVDKKLELLREKKKTLERLKKGLMNDLLTGRRRVKIEPPKETLF